MIFSFLSSGEEYQKGKVIQEEGFVDFTLPLTEFTKQKSGEMSLETRADLNGTKVGFKVEFLAKWEPQQIEETDDYLYWGNAKFISLGKDTDNFINHLAKLYGLGKVKEKALKSIDIQVVGIVCNPQDMDKEPTRMKLFFNPSGEEDLYSEVFLNVDKENGILCFNEKDNDYRAPLIKSLTK